jgi:hypothetical protein
MIRKTILISFCLVVLAPALTARVTSPQVAAPNLRAPQRGALERWLQSQPKLRLAIEKDCRNADGLAASRVEYGGDYQPYYAVGDFNRDGQQDFAVALINGQKRSRRFAIAIFNGPFNQRRPGVPTFFADGIDLSEGGLVVLSGNRLVAGMFQSDNCVTLQPRGKSYVMKSCL